MSKISVKPSSQSIRKKLGGIVQSGRKNLVWALLYPLVESFCISLVVMVLVKLHQQPQMILVPLVMF